MRILLKISYIGTNYHGWQVQPNGITIQETLQKALMTLYGHQVGITGCSRTDAGVHANEFYCHYDVEKIIPEKGIVSALNVALPDDISVIEASYIEDTFHARYSAKGKTYVYRIYNCDIRNPFEVNRSLQISRKLNVDKMNEFAKKLVGTYDFIGFSSSGRTVDDTVRTISECSVKRDGDIVTLSVTADGFLYNMVRIIVGTAIAVSDGKIDPQRTKELILSKDRNLAGATAPAHGLYLNKVIY